jgi:hypothetical protein
MSPEARNELIARVLRSLRIIEQEAERHNMLDSGVNAFDDDDRELIVDLLRERERIHTAIVAAAQREDFEQFMGELMRALDLNCRAMDLLANRFLELVREDCGRVRLTMQRIRSKEAQLQ